jgi:hypothetical protein
MNTILVLLGPFLLLWFSTNGNRYFIEKENEDYSKEIRDIINEET